MTTFNRSSGGIAAMTDTEKKIKYSSPEAAQFKEGISGWVSASGRFWGTNEHMARWEGCTHIACEGCGEDTEKGWTKCRACRETSRKERFLALPRQEWDGVTPLYSDSHDQYFFDAESLEDYLSDHGASMDDMDLCICRQVKMRQLDEDYFLEDLHEDAECPDDLQAAIAKVNQIVQDMEPICWEPSKVAAIVEIRS